MKKLISFVLILSLCILPVKSNAYTVVKTEALNIPLKTQFADFSKKEQSDIKELSAISNNNPLSKATFINEIKDNELYEFCLKEILDTYYGDLETYSTQLNQFNDNISSKAYDIINNYEVAAEERAIGEDNGYSPTEVITCFEPGTSKEVIKTIANNLGKGYEIIFDGFLNPADDIPEIRKNHINPNKDYGAIISIEVDLDKTTFQTIEEIGRLTCVKSCSRNDLLETTAVASDYSQEPRLSDQYYLDRINIGDAWLAIDNSWDFTETRVAVLDTGLDIDHEDVVGNYLSNYSYDVTKTGHPKLKDITTPYTDNHGTAVWGVIRARPLNKTGITGMHLPVQEGYSGVIRVMAIKIMEDGEDRLSIDNCIAGITRAINAGASIINMSFVFKNKNDTLYAAIKTAYDADVTMVASAGNDGDSAYRYPACYDEVIGVASTDYNNEMAYFTSNNKKIDICAPGIGILTLDLEDGYCYSKGTSISAPMVSGTVALMQSFYMHDTLAPSIVKEVLKETAVDLGTANTYNDLLNTGKAVEYTRYLAMKEDELKIRSVVLSNSNKSKLRWYNLPYASCDGFKIYRSTSENGTYTSVATIKYDDTLWDGEKGCFYWYDNDSQSGRTYYYKVRAYVKYGTGKKYSNYTGVKSITIP